jgi:hypothetical protein
MARGQGCDRRQLAAQTRGNVVHDLPLYDTDRVYHVGTLDLTNKGRDIAHSYEGHSLSVSPCPAAWERIAKLGGQSWFELENAAGSFLDAHELTVRQRTQIGNWAVERGYVSREPRFFASWEDDDGGYRFTCASRRKALEELVSLQPDPTLASLRDGISHGETLVGSPTLDARIGFAAGDDASDFCLLCYVEDEHPELDGVWWDESRGELSAPRAGILPGRVGLWQARELSSDERDELTGDEF